MTCTTDPLRLGSFCTGYGGLDMAVQTVFDAELAWTADNNRGAAQIITHRWPHVPNLGDISAVDWAAVPPVDVVAAGFPCQDISYAGRGAGMTKETRSGLWFVIADALRQLRPALVVVENVAALRRRGLDRVLGDLAALGYDTAWTSLRASDVGAAHRRERMFLLAADPDSPRLPWRRQPRVPSAGQASAESAGCGLRVPAADPDSLEPQRRGEPAVVAGSPRSAAIAAVDAAGRGGTAAADAQGQRHRDAGAKAQPWIPAAAVHGAPVGVEAEWRADDQLIESNWDRIPDWGVYEAAIRRWEHVMERSAPAPTELGTRGQPRLAARFVEWMMGLPDGHVTAIPGLSRTAQMHALGNGVVPQQGAAGVRQLTDAVRSIDSCS
ncbi:DNA cytosine methyltransferase [Nonomuraea sp. NPDC059023]|uniref:DNA cytosine methyltransferase n=1 Tax=unclassified Nonomuraea TaxID=2593643 RepID=UPI0036A9E926